MDERGTVTLTLLPEGPSSDDAPDVTDAEENASAPNSTETIDKDKNVTPSLNDQIKVVREEIEKKLRSEYLEKQRKDELLLKKKAESIEKKISEVSELFVNIENSFVKFQEKGFQEHEPLIVEVVIASLYKVLGDFDVNESYVKNTIAGLIKECTDDSVFSLRVSEDVYLILKPHFKDEHIMSVTTVDRNLNTGQIVFQDDNCVRELGLVERLDVLKNTLVNQLRKSNELSSL